MKEYKVIKPKLGWRNQTDKMEEILNKYAKEGWRLVEIATNQHVISLVVFERDKNR